MNIFDSTQTKHRAALQQLFPYLSSSALDQILSSVDQDLTAPLRVDASSTPNLIVTINSSVASNSESGRQRSIPHISNVIPSFSTGTVTFPSINGGTILVSPGSNVTLTLPSNTYTKVLISLDSTGSLIVSQGNTNAVEANATVPAPIGNTLPIAYISLFNNAGTVQAVHQNKIFQLPLGSGGSGTPAGGFARNVSLPAAATSFTVTFPSSLLTANYIPLVQFVNTVDANPQFQPMVVTNKTINGFTVVWNAPLDSANYSLDYDVPVINLEPGEKAIPAAASSITVDLPVSMTTTNYVVIAQLVNYIDGSPQFQPVTITSKSTTQFVATWNAPTDSANYKLAFQVAEFQ